MTLPVQPKWTLTLLIRIWEQEFGREKAAPTVPGEELMCQDPGEIQSYSVSSSLWYRTHCNRSPVGTAISTPFDSIISWVTFSSWLQRKPGSPTPARSKAAWSSVAGRQMHICDSSEELAAVSHQLTESFHETALRGSQGNWSAVWGLLLCTARERKHCVRTCMAEERVPNTSTMYDLSVTTFSSH